MRCRTLQGRVLLCVVLALVVGCQTTTTTRQRRGTPARADGGLPGPLDLDAPCASRLHDIQGMILMYVALNKRLPPTLDDAKPFADFDQTADLTCPASGEPYVYVPNGLVVEGRSKRIVVHDAAPTHNGRRWCILLEPAPPGKPLAMEVVDVPEVFFRTYRPAP